MAANMQKIKLLKLYELLRKETDETHPISRVELCRRLNEMGISSNVRTLSLDIEVMQENGFEIMSYLKDKEKFYYVPEHELTVPEIKILIDAVQAASFITEKKTAELIEKVAALGGSHVDPQQFWDQSEFRRRLQYGDGVSFSLAGTCLRGG